MHETNATELKYFAADVNVIREIMAFGRRNAALVGVIWVAWVGIALFALQVIPPTYQATAKVRISPSAPAAPGVPPQVDSNRLEGEAAILRSDAFLSRLVTPSTSSTDVAANPGNEAEQITARTIPDIAKRLHVQRISGSALMEVSFTAQSRAAAETMLTRIVNAYVQMKRDEVDLARREARRALAGALDDARGRVIDAEVAFLAALAEGSEFVPRDVLAAMFAPGGTRDRGSLLATRLPKVALRSLQDASLRLEAVEREHETLLGTLERATAAAALPLEDVQVVSLPTAGAEPISPQPVLFIGLGNVIGIGFGAAIAYLLEAYRRPVLVERDIRAAAPQLFSGVLTGRFRRRWSLRSRRHHTADGEPGCTVALEIVSILDHALHAAGECSPPAPLKLLVTAPTTPMRRVDLADLLARSIARRGRRTLLCGSVRSAGGPGEKEAPAMIADESEPCLYHSRQSAWAAMDEGVLESAPGRAPVSEHMAFDVILVDALSARMESCLDLVQTAEAIVMVVPLGRIGEAQLAGSLRTIEILKRRSTPVVAVGIC